MRLWQLQFDFSTNIISKFQICSIVVTTFIWVNNYTRDISRTSWKRSFWWIGIMILSLAPFISCVDNRLWSVGHTANGFWHLWLLIKRQFQVVTLKISIILSELSLALVSINSIITFPETNFPCTVRINWHACFNFILICLNFVNDVNSAVIAKNFWHMYHIFLLQNPEYTILY